MLKEKVPLNIVVPIIVVTWILSVVSSFAIMYVMPSLVPLRSEQIKDAIPYRVLSQANSTDVIITTSTSFIDMPGTEVTINVASKSRLIIMFSSIAYAYPAGSIMFVRAMVNDEQAHPKIQDLWFTSQGGVSAWQSNSYTFHSDILEAGSYEVKMQWRVYSGSHNGRIGYRTLTVIALPA